MDLREKFIRFTGKDENEAFLDELFQMARDKILNFCHIEELPPELENMQFEIAIKIYNRIGMEEAKSFSEGGQSTQFDDLINDNMKQELYRFRRFA